MSLLTGFDKEKYDELKIQYSKLKDSINKKEKLEEIENELRGLRDNMIKVKKQILKLKTTYSPSDIFNYLKLNNDIKSDILKNVTSLQIYNKDGLSCHSLAIKYKYDSTCYMFHFGRRPDEYYHRYSIFINGKLTTDRNIVKEFDDFNYNKINDVDYFSNHIISLSNQKE